MLDAQDPVNLNAVTANSTMKELKSVFDSFDKNKDGRLCKNEFFDALKDIRFENKHEAYETLFEFD